MAERTPVADAVSARRSTAEPRVEVGEPVDPEVAASLAGKALTLGGYVEVDGERTNEASLLRGSNIQHPTSEPRTAGSPSESSKVHPPGPATHGAWYDRAVYTCDGAPDSETPRAWSTSRSPRLMADYNREEVLPDDLRAALQEVELEDFAAEVSPPLGRVGFRVVLRARLRALALEPPPPLWLAPIRAGVQRGNVAPPRRRRTSAAGRFTSGGHAT